MVKNFVFKPPLEVVIFNSEGGEKIGVFSKLFGAVFFESLFHVLITIGEWGRVGGGEVIQNFPCKILFAMANIRK